MSIPLESNSSFTAAFSASEIPSTGAGNKADPPPETSAKTGPVALDKAAITACPAARPFSSGTG